eukprot:jgi/Botrbrau1/3186/Bobra.37_2s0016.1
MHRDSHGFSWCTALQLVSTVQLISCIVQYSSIAQLYSSSRAVELYLYSAGGCQEYSRERIFTETWGVPHVSGFCPQRCICHAGFTGICLAMGTDGARMLQLD